MKVRQVITYLLFEVLMAYTCYLYSLRWDAVPWGSNKHDGLYFLTYFIVILPLLIVVSFFKNYLLKNKASQFYRISYYVYVVLASLPGIISLRSQLILSFGVTITFAIAVANIVEFLFFFKFVILRNKRKIKF